MISRVTARRVAATDRTVTTIIECTPSVAMAMMMIMMMMMKKNRSERKWLKNASIAGQQSLSSYKVPRREKTPDDMDARGPIMVVCTSPRRILVHCYRYVPKTEQICPETVQSVCTTKFADHDYRQQRAHHFHLPLRESFIVTDHLVDKLLSSQLGVRLRSKAYVSHNVLHQLLQWV